MFTIRIFAANWMHEAQCDQLHLHESHAHMLMNSHPSRSTYPLPRIPSQAIERITPVPSPRTYITARTARTTAAQHELSPLYCCVSTGLAPNVAVSLSSRFVHVTPVGRIVPTCADRLLCGTRHQSVSSSSCDLAAHFDSVGNPVRSAVNPFFCSLLASIRRAHRS